MWLENKLMAVDTPPHAPVTISERRIYMDGEVPSFELEGGAIFAHLVPPFALIGKRARISV